MKKILVFIFEGMTDYEITFVMHLLNTSGNMEIITIAYDKEPIVGRSGLKVVPNKSLEEVKLEEVEGLIIPGGWFGDFKPALINMVKGLNEKGKLLAGICGAGTVVLAKSGILKEAKYTTPVVEWTSHHKAVFSGEDPFQRSNYIKERAVRDNNVITAVGPAFIDFAVKICDWFNLFEGEEEKIGFLKDFQGK